ncbi:MAG: hypothetical protein KGZ40_09145 [Clostridiales bacterium]|nr:hypothetical protein [Clostridiales bacterium]
MRSAKLRTAVVRVAQVAVIFLALPVTTVLSVEPWALHQDWQGVLQFLLVITVLNLFDVYLPHGGSVDVDTPLVIASLYLFGPMATLAIVVLSRCVASAVRSGRAGLGELIHVLAKRAAAIIAATVMIRMLSSSPLSLPGPYVEVAGLGAVFVTVQLLVGQLEHVIVRGDSLLRALRSNIALQGLILVAGVSVAVLTVLIYDQMGAWALVVTLFLVAAMRQSFALLLDVRRSYQTTIETLISAMEIQSPEQRGQGERTARLARIAAGEYGWVGKRVEQMSYAALLLHYGLSFHRREPGSESLAATPLSEVEFLEPVQPILGLVRDESGFEEHSAGDLVSAYLVSRAFAHEQGYELSATLRIGNMMSHGERKRADAAFTRAIAKVAVL